MFCHKLIWLPGTCWQLCIYCICIGINILVFVIFLSSKLCISPTNNIFITYVIVARLQLLYFTKHIISNWELQFYKKYSTVHVIKNLLYITYLDHSFMFKLCTCLRLWKHNHDNVSSQAYVVWQSGNSGMVENMHLGYCCDFTAQDEWMSHPDGKNVS